MSCIRKIRLGAYGRRTADSFSCKHLPRFLLLSLLSPLCVVCWSTLTGCSFPLLQGVASLLTCSLAIARWLPSPLAETMSSSDSKPALWLRCETKPHEHRSVAVPCSSPSPLL